MSKIIARVLLLSVAAGAPAAAAGEEAFPIAGTYLENVVCKGDPSDPADKRVKITATTIDSSFGLCTLGDRRRNGMKITAQITCKDPSTGGALTSDIHFTMRDDKNLDFADQYETYKAVLFRCPE